MEILLPRMKCTHEIVGTHGEALLPERAPGATLGTRGFFLRAASNLHKISHLPFVCKNKGNRIFGQKQCHSVNRRILFEIARMQSVNPRIAASFYASVMKVYVLKVRPVVRRKNDFIVRLVQLELRGTATIYNNNNKFISN